MTFLITAIAVSAFFRMEGGFPKNTSEKPAYRAVVSFTFDDGPGENTVEILKLLKQYEGTATFFINGKNIAGRENTLKTAVAWGNELGNHTYGHIALTGLTDEQIKEEISRTQKAVKAVLPDYKLRFVRPPYGRLNAKTAAAIEYPIVLWTIDSGDWRGIGPGEIKKSVLNDIKDGDIVVFHDDASGTERALQMILPVLRDRGFRILTVSELMRIKGYRPLPREIIRQVYS